MKQTGISERKWWRHWWVKGAVILLVIYMLSLLASVQMTGQACIFEGLGHVPPSHYMPLNLLYFSSWGILFLLIQRVCNFMLKRTHNWFIIVPAHIALAVIVSFVHLWMVHFLFSLGGGLGLLAVRTDFNFMRITYRWINSNIYIYIAIAGYLHVYYYFRELRERELRNSQLETEMVQIQLQSLKMQMHPHFLFNALNTISACVKGCPDTAIKMIARLSDLLRVTLDTRENQEITLEEELKITKNYLDIEQMRFADRLELNFSIAPGTPHALVPALVLQPLAENAVRHGISRKMEKGAISISAFKEKSKLILQVEDDGPGFIKKSSPGNQSNGIGLNNIRQRIKKLYGDKASMIIDNNPDNHIDKNGKPGFRVKLILPFRTLEDDARIDYLEFAEDDEYVQITHHR